MFRINEINEKKKKDMADSKDAKGVKEAKESSPKVTASSKFILYQNQNQNMLDY